MKYFRDLVEGKKLIIKTDHKPLTYELGRKSKKSSPRQLRQLNSIGQFTTENRCVAGEDNVVADPLSHIASINMPVSITIEETAAAQRVDEELPKILESREHQLHKFQLDSGISVYCDTQTEIRAYIPAGLRIQIFHMTHSIAKPSGRSTSKHI